jgi:plasmid stability protein
MAVVTVRNLPEETHRALRMRAAQHGRSTEAEIRVILEDAVRPERRLKIGSALSGSALAGSILTSPEMKARRARLRSSDHSRYVVSEPLTSSLPSRDEDSFRKTAMSRREDIVSCIGVTSAKP